MPPSASAAIVRWFADTFDRAAGVSYEMFGLQDSFGKVLKENLKVRQNYNAAYIIQFKSRSRLVI
jgi:[phosphatase 2A protein]-leucine-carboxy methyltransferase